MPNESPKLKDMRFTIMWNKEKAENVLTSVAGNSTSSFPRKMTQTMIQLSYLFSVNQLIN